MPNIKTFISFDAGDGSDFANALYEHYQNAGYDVFMSKKSIFAGEDFKNRIIDNISVCDIFISLITHNALTSYWVEWEFLEAIRLRKNIIPCVYHNIKRNDLRWAVDRMHQIKFDSQWALIRELDSWFINKLGYETPTSKKIRIKKDLELIRGGVKKEVDLNEVIDYLENEPHMDSRYMMSLQNICSRRARAGKFEEAVYCYDKSMELIVNNNVNNSQMFMEYALVGKGECLTKLRRYDEAIATLNEAIKLKPDESSAIFYRALANANTGNNEEALVDIKKYVEIGSEGKNFNFQGFQRFKNNILEEEGFESLRNDYRLWDILK